MELHAFTGPRERVSLFRSLLDMEADFLLRVLDN